MSAEPVSLMSQPAPIATIHTEDVWSLDRLDAVLPQTLIRGLRNEFAPREKGASA